MSYNRKVGDISSMAQKGELLARIVGGIEGEPK